MEEREWQASQRLPRSKDAKLEFQSADRIEEEVVEAHAVVLEQLIGVCLFTCR